MADTHTTPAGLPPQTMPDELVPQGPPPAGWAPPPAGGANAELPPPPHQAGAGPVTHAPQQQPYPQQQGYPQQQPHPQQQPNPQQGYGAPAQFAPQPPRELSWDETDEFWEPVRPGEVLNPVQSWDHIQPLERHRMERPQSYGSGKVIASGVCAAISLLFLPIIFGPAAILFGHLADKEGHPKGAMLKWLSVICMICGFVLGALMYRAALNGQ